jgi:dihydroorotate dehydrogenase
MSYTIKNGKKMLYRLLRSILFKLPPEVAHKISLESLRFLANCHVLSFMVKPAKFAPKTVMNLVFPNMVGLAAGLDSNGDYVDALATLGFGFIEVGGVTPDPQPGNPKPRLFRIPEYQAIINRMGFCNKGVDYLASRLAKSKYKGILGINIAKNRDTPIENAVDDYLTCIRKLKTYASYFTVNISSPNTPGLRLLQQPDFLAPLLKALKQEAGDIPLAVKLSPDMTMDELNAVVTVLMQVNIDGIIATNTTIARHGIEQSQFAAEAGGLSGRPLSARSTAMIRQLHTITKGKIPIIASGGVMDAKTAKEKIDAGASLLQVYTGFIYNGPAIIGSILL